MPQKLGNIDYYDASEVSKIINKSYETAVGRIRRGLIDAEKINGTYLVSHSELVRHLDEYEALPESIIELRLDEKPIAKAE